MYQFFYKLKSLPFELTPDPAFFYLSRGHRRAMAYLRYGLSKEEGFLVLTGEIGTGKTMLAAALLRDLAREAVIGARVATSQLAAYDMLEMVAASFGLEHEGKSKTALIKRIESYLVDQAEQGRRALLVVDEAQNIAHDALEELRLLSNLELEGRPLLQIFLFGQDEFRQLLRAPHMEQLRQRVVAAYHLGPLHADETREYVEHRLHQAGWNRDPVFTDEAFQVIHRFSGGVPRRINTLCDRLLLYGYLEELHEITADVVGVVIEELRQEAFLNGEAPSTMEPLRSRPAPPEPVPAAGDRVTALEAEVRSLRATVAEAMAALAATQSGRRVPARPALRRPARRGDGVLCVVGARPNFMKMAPVMRALRDAPGPVRVRLVHTGQHYDEAMKDTFFRQLGLPQPDIDLEVGSASHAVQTAEIMRRFEPVLEAEDPACVVVVGDVNSTLACALVAAKAGRPVAHVEAGLRSFDRTMPEEINRVLTDQLAELLFCTEPKAVENLRAEGIENERIHLVGNVMIDSLLQHRDLAVAPAQTLARHGADPALIEGEEGYILLTLHRPSNVDDPAVLRRLIKTIRGISDAVPVVFPVHPRTAARIEEAGLGELLGAQRILRLPPLGYLETLGLMRDARLVMTDSGGMQEETTALGVPCVTLRDNTERPITVEQGTNRLVGSDPNRILAAVDDVLANGVRGRAPELWDGHAAERIRDILVSWLNGRAN